MKNKATQGLGNTNLLSFDSFPKHDSLKYWRLRSKVNSSKKVVVKTLFTHANPVNRS